MYDFWKRLSNEEKNNFAVKVGSSAGYLRLVFSGHKKPGFKLCHLIEQGSGGEITKSELRPDIYP